MRLSWKRAARRIAFLALLVTLLIGCQTIQPTLPRIPITGVVEAVPCRDLRQLSFDAELDTAETIRDLRRQNAVIGAICK
jgi:hypothetical protein